MTFFAVHMLAVQLACLALAVEDWMRTRSLWMALIAIAFTAMLFRRMTGLLGAAHDWVEQLDDLILPTAISWTFLLALIDRRMERGT